MKPAWRSKRARRHCVGWLALAVFAWLIGCAGAGRSSLPCKAASCAAARSAAQNPALAVGEHGAVSSAEVQASAVGIAVLKRGGNAVDAAVAVAFALGVTHPSAANIGGGGFMLVRLADGSSTAIDYREVAPRAAHRDMYLDAHGEPTQQSRAGPLAAGVPGVVAGLARAHARFGTRPWAELIEPAIRLAREGSRLDVFHAEELAFALEDVRAFARELAESELSGASGAEKSLEARRALASALRATLATFGKQDGAAYAAGETWRQPELAGTLGSIARDGPEAFYRGPLAATMAERVRAMGGIWSVEDLHEYGAVERAPVAFRYREHEIITMPPPSAGGVVLRQVLAASELLGLHALDWDSPERIHLFVEILRRTYADRNQLVADPAFVQIPLEQLLNTRYLAERMAAIDRAHATPSSRIAAGLPVSEPPHTTHFSVVDASGMAVANTFTLNTSFGALVQIPGTGVTLNNEMDDFTAKPGAPNAFGLVQGPQNAIAPGKRMLSSMSPTIVARDGKLRAVLGSPGGPTITTTVAQILMQLIDHERTLQRAVEAPRVHHQWMPDQIWLEANVPRATREALQRLGHRLEIEESIGHAHCIEVDTQTRKLRAVADVARGGGGALAY